MTVARVHCKLNHDLQNFIIEPNLDNLADGTIMPCTYHNSGSQTQACVINMTDDEIILWPDTDIGKASEAIETEPVNFIDNKTPGGVNHPSINRVSGNLQIPTHLIEMIDRAKPQLNTTELNKLTDLLIEYQDVFAQDEFDLGNFTEIEHKIDTGNAKPIKLRMRRTPACFVNEEKAHLDKMLDAGVIQPSISEWAAAPVLVRKKCGGVRWCIDWRKLNEVTTKDQFPLPLIDECLDTLSGSKWFSKLDANSAYWQVKIAKADQHKTAFITKYGLFEFARLGFGLTGAPATFSRVMNLVLRGLTWEIALAFLDDIMVLGLDFENHLENLRKVLDRFRSYGLKLKPKKCDLFNTKVEFLGHVVSEGQIEIGSGYIDALLNWQEPTCTKDVERFLGFVNYHRNFIKDLAKLAVPLYAITGKKQFLWGNEQKTAFEQLKSALSTKPVLAIPNQKGEFILDCDASDYAIGGELSQIQDGVERVIGYCSFALSSEQTRYCTTRKELLAIIRCTKQYKHHLIGRKFTVRTDHNSLTWLCRFKEPQGQLARWIEELSQYNMVLQHRPGHKHVNADELSRLRSDVPCSEFNADIDIKELPCHGCDHCEKAHNNWYRFSQDVDDVRNYASAAHEVPVNQEQNCDESVTTATQVKPLIARLVNEGWTDLVTEHPGNNFHENENFDENRIDLETDLSGNVFNTKLFITGSPNVMAIGTAGKDNGFSFSGYTADELKSHQAKDRNLSLILSWLCSGDSPNESELFKSSKAQKYYWINKEQFVLKGDVLYKMVHDTDKTLLVVPSTLRDEILQLSHADLKVIYVHDLLKIVGNSVSNVQIAFISSDLLRSSLFGITCFWLIPIFDFGL